MNREQNSFQQMQPTLLSINEVCRLVGVGRTTCYVLVQNGQLRVCRIRGRTLITAASVNELIASHTITTSKKGGA